MTPAMERMIKARTGLLMRHPFWATLAFYLKFEESTRFETMATDGETLWFNPDFVATLTDAELEFVLAHEISHCAYNHHTRRGQRDIELWNEAGDYAINRDLIKAGFTVVDDILHDDRFDNMSTEEIHAVLLGEKQKQDQQQQQNQQQGQPQAGQGQPQLGQGQGQQGQSQPGQGQQGQPVPKDKGKAGLVLDAAKPGDLVEQSRVEEEWRIRVTQAMSVESGRHAGQIPGHLKRMFEGIKTPPQDWRSILRRFIDDRARFDYSWTKPNTRYLSMGFVVPGMIPDGVNKIGVAIDTSMSIDKRALGFFMHELQAAVDDGATQQIIVVCCDTKVHCTHEFHEGDKIDFEPKGGGGTKFSPALKWFADNEPDVSAIIYFTDLDCSDYGEEPEVPVLWLGYGPANKLREHAKNVPFGEVLPLVA